MGGHSNRNKDAQNKYIHMGGVDSFNLLTLRYGETVEKSAKDDKLK